MKKILALPTVLVFLITILVAAGCSSPLLLDDCEIQNTKKVKILVKATKDNHLEMYDSNNPTVIVDDLETCVLPRMKVTWEWTEDSEIQKFVRIGPPAPGQIIPGDARKVFLTNKLRLRIPNDATTGQEKYVIEFLDLDGNHVPIDPILKIP